MGAGGSESIFPSVFPLSSYLKIMKKINIVKSGLQKAAEASNGISGSND